MKPFSIHMTGVGGQGIGLLSEILLRAADHAGHDVKAVDTHGLAQRGGIVVSQLRFGDRVFTPLIRQKQADLVIALERHEAMRALEANARQGAALIYYNTVWQPLDVRMGAAAEITAAQLGTRAKERQVRLYAVHEPDLPDARMQNVMVLAHMDRHGLLPGVTADHLRMAMEDVMAGTMLKSNVALFESKRTIA